ncbi:MAG: glycosyl transferase [Ignavibacteriae bacterium]|nr:MAG: glycosyl transferase [Ignavibacteriota bacterium]
MKYGYFDDEHKEYVITRPDTPLPWFNYLGTNDFYGIISNTAGGYCFYQDAKLRRLTRYRYNNIPMDSNGRYLYIKDGDTLWNPMWKPMRVPLDHYECRHGLGYSKITGQKNELEVSSLFFIPLNSRNEIWQVNVTNHSKSSKKIRMWSFAEWCLWDALDDMTNFQRNYSTGQVEVENGTIFHITEYRERRNHYAYFSSSEPVSGFDSSRDAFVGVHQGLDAPQAILEGGCRNSIAYGWLPVGVHQIDLDLKPGETKTLNFLLGYAENPPEKKFLANGKIRKDEFEAVKSRYSKTQDVDAAFQAHRQYWDNLVSSYQVKTPDTIVNRMANIWNQYQCMVTFNMSRSTSMYESGIGRGMGYRDSNQDILGFVHILPERAKQRILDLAGTQLSDGTCFHQYQPLTKKGNADIGGGFNDDPLWLILSVSAYLKETGDLSILDEKVGYADVQDTTSTLLDHLNISLHYTLNHRGPHGLPLIGHADWNDCLNLNCFSSTPGESFQLAGHIENDKIAESVMIAGLFCKACDEMTKILNTTGQSDAAAQYVAHGQEMRNTIEKHGWDGEWFLRAYDSYSKKLGSSENEEGKIFIESQGWCILGGVGLNSGNAKKALDSVHKYLATSNGIILQQPAFQKYYVHLGEVSSYPPGYKENAGIFTHNNTWIQIAETLVGRGDQAMEYYKSICPPTKEEQIDIYRSEPYVYSQMTAGKDAPTPGEGKNSWLTGTVAWSFVALSQYILGIHPDYNGLIIDPCIPSSWQEYTVVRKYRKSTYRITIKNPNKVCKGVKSLTLDGKPVNGNVVPNLQDGKEHAVEVILG